MRTMSLDITGLGPRHKRRWSQVKQGLAEWRHRVYSRGELLESQQFKFARYRPVALLLDFEASKPFWMA